MSNFSFSHSTFYRFGELKTIFVKLKIVGLQTLSVWKSLKSAVWERVKLKGLADNILKVAQTTELVFDRVGNIVVKGENIGFQHFLILQQSFQEVFISRIFETRDCDKLS